MAKLENLLDSSNGAAPDIEVTAPYIVDVTLEGTAAILFHAWNNEAVEEKAKSAKGSKAKKSDNVESYVYRNDKGEICIPGEYLRMSIINAAKYQQDPRSPRKSAMDLYKAALVSLTELASLGSKDWDYLDRPRCVVQRNAITRIRPAFFPGWKASFTLRVLLPEYVSPQRLHQTIREAGELIGVGDWRPTYGRFQIVNWHVR